MTYDDMNYDGKFLIIPNDEESHRDLLNIDRHTKEDVRRKHRLYIDMDWEANTISYVTVETLVKVLYTNIKDNGISILTADVNGVLNFYDLIEVSASNKKNESAEKTGNINVKFHPGEMVNDIITDDIPRSEKQYEYVTAEAACCYLDDEDRTSAMLKIDKITRKILADKHSVILPKDYMAISIAKTFLENVYRELVQKIVLLKKPIVTINFNDLIEFHATRKQDSIDIKLRPGMGAKLIIKSDESTEADDDGFDD